MTVELSFLENVMSIPPCPFGFADGNTSYASHTGMLHLSNNITLLNVLFVPNLKCSLISVAKLLRQTNLFALLTDTLCVLQDRFTRTLIGAGEERDGVYFFKDVMAARVQVADKLHTSVDQFLWHQWLGHPSFSDTCFEAKQTREVFYESLNKTKECFELIHCDVWGLYRTYSSSEAVYF